MSRLYFIQAVFLYELKYKQLELTRYCQTYIFPLHVNIFLCTGKIIKQCAEKCIARPRAWSQPRHQPKTRQITIDSY